eukprot:m.229237 g.229237  ORF g.229237 m.229237 type:complete len:113 (+) comp17334_c0_seq13:2119-2457(+)
MQQSQFSACSESTFNSSFDENRQTFHRVRTHFTCICTWMLMESESLQGGGWPRRNGSVEPERAQGAANQGNMSCTDKLVSTINQLPSKYSTIMMVIAGRHRSLSFVGLEYSF